MLPSLGWDAFCQKRPTCRPTGKTFFTRSMRSAKFPRTDGTRSCTSIPIRKAKDKIYSKWGGFLDDVAFDPMKYGMPPASLRSIEPAQLLTLEVVRAALEDAGYSDRPFARERTSVIFGAGGGAADLGLGYGARSFIPVLENLPEFRGRSREILERLDGRLPEWTEDSFAGILTNVSAGRVANRFDLGGSNYTVDAACASSLAAVSLALKELEGQTSDMVIVGGIDTMQNPFTYLCFSKTQALSPRGRCRTFDESADGIAISEGIAMMVLKRLDDAERDGDRIYAVIKGAGSSSDGKDRGLTAPRPEGQARALKRAYAKAGISPATVGLIEAHGTGTVAGDGAEVQALTQVFSEAQAQRQGCAIGSVKSMIGHTKCCAGAAGLIKVALALHHKVLPPTLGVQKPNPRARFPETPFFVNTEPRPWLESPSGHPRRAGVSAFGFGGTNFHVVVEEYTGDPVSTRLGPCRQWPDELFLWTADSRQALLDTVETWDKALAVEAKPALRDLAYTAWKQADDKATGNNRPALQLAIIASSSGDLRQKLAWARQSLARPEATRINDPRGIYFSEQPLAPGGKLAFLFPGQGSQYPHMLQDLIIHFPEMQDLFELAVQILSERLGEPLTAYVFPPPSFSPEEEQSRRQALTQTNIAQPAIGAASLAMLGLLQELGLRPDMLAGHSYGEYVALAAAGVFSKETLIALSEARGRFIVEAAGEEPGVMAAIEAEADVVESVLKGIEDVCLANANAPRQTVISGSKAGVERAVEQFTSQGTTARMIPVACAFHSPFVASAQARLAQFLSTVEVAEPTVTVYSNTTAAPYPKEPDALTARLVEHLVRPVEFAREVEAMYAAGARVFVEVGPRNVLTSLVDQILGERPKLAVASNQSGRPGLTQLLHLLGQLAAQGVALKFDRLYRDRSVRRLDLSALQRESGEKPLAPSVWLVNGARAKPLKDVSTRTARQEEVSKVTPLKPHNEPANRAAPRAFPPATNPPAVGATAPTVPGTGVAPIGTPPVPPTASPGPSVSSDPAVASPTSMDGIPQVMAQFQQMMARFLDTQKSIMLTYLGAGSGAPALDSLPAAVALPAAALPSAPLAAEQPHQAELGVLQPAHSGTASAAPQALSAQEARPHPSNEPVAGPDLQELTARLLSIVSERTGYPTEMLGLNLDLEADLGIDSIKRVEILGTLQQSFAAAGGGAVESMMESLAGVRTLQGIVERVAEQLGARPAGQSSGQVPASGQLQEQASPSAAAGLDKEELTTRLLAMVSERTGYPIEMLGLDLDLEADLGVDSIKRVEILGNFQQSFTVAGVASPDGMMEKLAGVRTLRGIVEGVAEHLEAKSESERPTVPSAAKATEAVGSTAVPLSLDNDGLADKRIRRFTLAAVETPLKGRSRSVAMDRAILITDDEHGVARALADELLGHGYNVALVRSGQDVQELDQGSYAADLGSPESVIQLIALVNQRQGALGGIVHLLSLRGGAAFASLDYENWKERLRLGTKSLFHLAKAAGKDLRKATERKGACLIAATGMGGAFMSDLPSGAQAQFPDQGGVVGLMKTLALEWPDVHVKAVDLNPQESSQTLARHLFDELQAGDEIVEVGYDGRRRVTLEPTHAPLRPEGPPALAIDRSSVILITGGARGITARTACRLAERHQPTLVLVGRSPQPEPDEATETTGITSPKDLKAALMEQMRARAQPVTPARVEQAYARLTAEREVRGDLGHPAAAGRAGALPPGRRAERGGVRRAHRRDLPHVRPAGRCDPRGGRHRGQARSGQDPGILRARL